MDSQLAISELAPVLGIELSGNDFSFHRNLLAQKINELIDRDINKLVSILYRMDVSESRLRAMLSENKGTDAGGVIADLMIERQIRKMEARKNFKPDENADENERW